DTRQHGPVETSDALRAIERHSGVRPVELHAIRRQDPTLGRDADERTRIRQYRKAVESAAAGKMAESFERLDKIGAVVSCGLGEDDGRFVTVSNKALDRISVCQPRELPVAEGDRLHLKANRRLASGRRVTNGEIVTAKAVHADGEIELSDGRVLDKSFREF